MEDTNFPSTSSYPGSSLEDDDSNLPPTKRTKRSNSHHDNNDLLDYFRGKDAEEKSYKEKELELKERELNLKERELALREQELEWKMQQAADQADKTGKAALLSLIMNHLK